ncbi:hypothetical protein SAMN00120144_1700 [Hymenobacter roseosalivarius DSM 11622]|uniref:Sel1 domain protein repeat-containing protein n=2 Tax=Hymenobacter roseosalivarius TaxID=89967 RepID=A0A1W1W491_9BACT|nr:hypothetical protein SAMN00120144_1700 [Hymenobacter roseosalivarius DSM 11622]
MNDLAFCYQKGLGAKQNVRLALRWFESALEAGETKALTSLGYCYMKLISPPAFVRAREYFE